MANIPLTDQTLVDAVIKAGEDKFMGKNTHFPKYQTLTLDAKTKRIEMRVTSLIAFHASMQANFPHKLSIPAKCKARMTAGGRDLVPCPNDVAGMCIHADEHVSFLCKRHAAHKTILYVQPISIFQEAVNAMQVIKQLV